MPSISDKISGLTFAQKVIDGDVGLKSMKSSFMALPPLGKEAAIEALRESGDPLVAQLADGLDGRAAAATPRATSFTAPARSSESARASSASVSVGRSG